jgi:hypothetical protein
MFHIKLNFYWKVCIGTSFKISRFLASFRNLPSHTPHTCTFSITCSKRVFRPSSQSFFKPEHWWGCQQHKRLLEHSRAAWRNNGLCLVAKSMTRWTSCALSYTYIQRFALKAALLKLLISAASVREGASTSISVDFWTSRVFYTYATTIKQ